MITITDKTKPHLRRARSVKLKERSSNSQAVIQAEKNTQKKQDSFDEVSKQEKQVKLDLALVQGETAKKGFMVAKSNQLIEAHYRLPLNFMRFILAALAKINSSETVDDRTFYQVTPADLIQAGVGPQRVRETMDQAEKVFERSIVEIPQPNGKVIRTHWIQSIIKDGDKCLGIKFSNDIVPYISGLRDNFTAYQVSIGSLSTPYAIRLFEHLWRFKSTGFFVVMISELVDRLSLPKSYSAYDIKRRILIPSIEDINAKTNLIVSAEMVASRGRKIDKVVFKFREKPLESEKSNRDENEPYTLTAKQKYFFAIQLHDREDFRSWFGRKIPMKNWDDAIPDIADALDNPKNKKEYLPWLEKVGFLVDFSLQKRKRKTSILRSNG